jgi:spermidine/putrescine transport system substrate-binding protein
MRDTVGSVLLGNGVEPEQATKDQTLEAIEKIERASRDGQVRRFTGNEYTRELLSGDTVACLGWSGDAVQLTADNENVTYQQPEEGFMIFTDSMQVPVGAPHAFTAQKMMDFVYRPEIQEAITAYVNYVPPVKGVRQRLERSDPEIAENELIFPDLSKSHNFKTFSEDEEQEIEAAFQAAIGT